MKAATIAEIKRELSGKSSDQLAALCLSLAKYKVQNKELLTYLLYESGDEQSYIQGVKSEISEQFSLLVKEKNLYFLKKTIRKILRLADKQIRYSGLKETELEVRIHFCTELKESGIPFTKNPVLVNLYARQLKKIEAALAGLPEDLQYDYKQAVDRLAL